MGVPDGIWYTFVFALGCCIGSFLNVVIYRLPREKSLVFPGSACPSCGKPIRFYDNIPLLSWLLLRGKCRQCKAPVSIRYFVIEFLTGVIFLGLFIVYFRSGLHPHMPFFLHGGWLVFLTHLILVSGLIAASGIDLELWIIPLSLCWFVTGMAWVANTVMVYVLDPVVLRQSALVPVATARTGALAAGGGVGLIVSLFLLATKVLKRSYADLEDPPLGKVQEALVAEENLNHRKEMIREILFVMPVILGSYLVYWLTQKTGFSGRWSQWMTCPAFAGFLGSFWGYLIGAAVVWATRILGTLAFGKEAMGLGDVHLMGAVGAVIGPMMVVIAFFVAPFFGLTWALVQMISKKIRQIPYGPFLSMATLVVMIFHDWILQHVCQLFMVTGGIANAM